MSGLNRRLCSLCVIVIPVVAVLLHGRFAGAVTSYHVGNSLTWDASLTRMQIVSQDQGIDLEVGYHIKCGRSLLSIWNDPTGTCIAPNATGTWDVALANNAWNHVTL